MATKYYLELSINERINLRSGFNCAKARISNTYNRLRMSTEVGKCAKKISQRVYNIDK